MFITQFAFIWAALCVCSSHGPHGFSNVAWIERRHARDVPWNTQRHRDNDSLARLQLLISTESRRRTFNAVIAYTVRRRHKNAMNWKRPTTKKSWSSIFWMPPTFSCVVQFLQLFLYFVVRMNGTIPFYWETQKKILWKWFHRWAWNGKCSLNARREKGGAKRWKQSSGCEPTNRFQALQDNDDPLLLLLLFRNILVGNTLSAFEMCSNQNEPMQNAYSVIASSHTHTHASNREIVSCARHFDDRILSYGFSYFVVAIGFGVIGGAMLCADEMTIVFNFLKSFSFAFIQKWYGWAMEVTSRVLIAWDWCGLLNYVWEEIIESENMEATSQTT